MRYVSEAINYRKFFKVYYVLRTLCAQNRACIGCFGIRDIALFLRDTGIKTGGGGIIILGYGMFEFLWGRYDIFENKKIINKHKITAALLFCSMISNFPWATSHTDFKARRIMRPKSMEILSATSMLETSLTRLSLKPSSK